MASYYTAPPIPSSFIWRRAHSLTGLWLVLFLIEHLFTNSQAALWFGDDGSGFVRSVNALKNLPYLQAIEIFLLGIPFLIHGIWGINYLFSAQYNSFATDGSTPGLPQYPRNKAYTWQRITSWILLIGVIAHVVQMRFLEYPYSISTNGQQEYVVRLDADNGLDSLSKRLGFEVYQTQQIQTLKTDDHPWLKSFDERPLKENQVAAVTPQFGVAELLMVRDTFKNPVMILLYTGFVLAACFHGFNGLWTFMIGWGITLTAASQTLMRKIAVFLMVLITFLGLAAIWGTYWINLRQ